MGIEGSVDEIKQGMEQILETGLAPRLYGHTIQSYTIDDKTVLVIHVPVSWNRPHMVIKGGDYRFYERTNAGVTKMSVDSLRNAFLGSAAIVEKAEKFRKQRIDKILQMPLRDRVTQKDSGIFVWHLLPYHSFSPGFQVNLTSEEALQAFRSLPQVGTGTFNFEGYIRTNEYDSVIRAYWQIFRDGKVEYAIVLHHRAQENVILPLRWVDVETRSSWLSGIILLRESLGLSPPYLVSISGLRVHGLRPYVDPGYLLEPHPITDREHLLFPFQVIEDWTPEVVERALRNLLDQFWQSFGIAKDIYFEQVVKPAIQELISH